MCLHSISHPFVELMESLSTVAVGILTEGLNEPGLKSTEPHFITVFKVTVGGRAASVAFHRS